jgi:hypothetical protein
MLSCKQSALLLTQSIDSPLPLHKACLLRCHLILCRTCSRLKKHLSLLKDATTLAANEDPRESPLLNAQSLSAKARHRILGKLREEDNSPDL